MNWKTYENKDLQGEPVLVKTGKTVLGGVTGTNTAGPAGDYINLYDAASSAAVTVGTTKPIVSLFVTGSKGNTYTITDGLSFENGLVVNALVTFTSNTSSANLGCFIQYT